MCVYIYTCYTCVCVYCIVSYCIVLHCIVLVLYYVISYHIVLHYIVLCNMYVYNIYIYVSNIVLSSFPPGNSWVAQLHRLGSRPQSSTHRHIEGRQMLRHGQTNTGSTCQLTACKTKGTRPVQTSSKCYKMV